MLLKKITYIQFYSLFLSLNVIFAYAENDQLLSVDITKLGGTLSNQRTNQVVFQLPAEVIKEDERRLFHVDGHFIFHKDFDFPDKNDSYILGPHFVHNSCGGCHVNDGRGAVGFNKNAAGSQMIIKISLPNSISGLVEKDPSLFVGQIQNHSLINHETVDRKDVNINLDWEYIKGFYADGTQYELRKPKLSFEFNLAMPDYKDKITEKNSLYSLRLTPPVIGMGLLEAIDEATILSFADPDDKNGDEISGRVNMVLDQEDGEKKIGRFGFKASHSSLREQTGAAFFNDMGISNSVFKGSKNGSFNSQGQNNQGQNKKRQNSGGSNSQQNNLAANNIAGDNLTNSNSEKRIDYSILADSNIKKNEGYELTELELRKTIFYLQGAGVSSARDQNDSRVINGKRLFIELNCSGCHKFNIKTGDHPVKELSGQDIHPFTDLLLHDMGEELSDNRPEFDATGVEWRTTPLWGLGMYTVLSTAEPAFLHDGRARSLEESILWHGGEAVKSRDQFKKLSKTDRDDLIKFLLSL